MPTPTRPVAPGAERSVARRRAVEPRVLWNRVIDAREVVTRERVLPLGRSLAMARGDLLFALDAYVASLVSRGLPVPYPLRDELRLQRLTCGPTYQPPSRPLGE